MIVNRILNFIGYKCINTSLDIANCKQYPKEEYKRYKKEDPYEMNRVTYPLNKDSIVVDAGGLNGDWASRMYCLYSCNIDIYEPNLKMFNQLKMNFKNNEKISSYMIGLSNKSENMVLHGDSYGASLYDDGSDNTSIISVEKASDIFIINYNGKQIDLLKLNVEGAEYDILSDLLQNYDMKTITDIQIQFHRNVKNYDKKRDEIRSKLSKTHIMTWNYDYIFENWTLITDTV